MQSFVFSIKDWSSAIMIILAGTKPEHLNMLEGGIIAKLLDEKWVTFAKVNFYIISLCSGVSHFPNTQHIDP